MSHSTRSIGRPRRIPVVNPNKCERNICEEVADKPQKKQRKFSNNYPKYYLPRKAPSSSPATHHRPSPANITINWSESEDDDPCPNCSCSIEIDKCKHFRPKLYDFMLQDYETVKDSVIENETKFKDNILIRCPEFATLLDHVIPVIWYFYRDWQNWDRLNIPQIEWAMKFLAGIYAEGTTDTFVDVETIRGHLQELLFIKYCDVDGCTMVPRTDLCTTECKISPLKCQIELPISLRALFYRAPGFTQYLATTPECPCALNGDERLSETTKLMQKQLDRLRQYELRYMQTLTEDAELHQIIDGIMVHADEIVRVREALELLSNVSDE